MNDFCFICGADNSEIKNELVVKKQAVLNGQIIKTNEMYYKICDYCTGRMLNTPNKLDKLFKK